MSTLPPNSGPQITQDEVKWLRLPRNGERCRLTGLSRTSIRELVEPCRVNGGRPPVRSILLRKKGALRGIRLISKESLLAYLDSVLEHNLGAET